MTPEHDSRFTVDGRSVTTAGGDVATRFEVLAPSRFELVARERLPRGADRRGDGAQRGGDLVGERRDRGPRLLLAGAAGAARHQLDDHCVTAAGAAAGRLPFGRQVDDRVTGDAAWTSSPTRSRGRAAGTASGSGSCTEAAGTAHLVVDAQSLFDGAPLHDRRGRPLHRQLRHEHLAGRPDHVRLGGPSGPRGLHGRRGTVSRNAAPLPSACSGPASTRSPPCARAMPRAMGRPRPGAAVARRAGPASSRTSRSKTRSRSASGTPGPSSATEHGTRLGVEPSTVTARPWPVPLRRPGGVVDEVAERPAPSRPASAGRTAQPRTWLAARPRTAPHPPRPEAPGRRSRSALDDRGDQRRQVDGRELELEAAVDARHQQHVVDEARRPGRLPDDVDGQPLALVGPDVGASAPGCRRRRASRRPGVRSSCAASDTNARIRCCSAVDRGAPSASSAAARRPRRRRASRRRRRPRGRSRSPGRRGAGAAPVAVGDRARDGGHPSSGRSVRPHDEHEPDGGERRGTPPTPPSITQRSCASVCADRARVGRQRDGRPVAQLGDQRRHLVVRP